jgi:hypothetical protein
VWTNTPCAQDRSVGRSNGDIEWFRVLKACHGANPRFILSGKNTSARMERLLR